LTSQPLDTSVRPEDRQVVGQSVSNDRDCVDMFVSQSTRYTVQALWSVDVAGVYVY